MKIVIDIDKRYCALIKYEVEHGNDFLPFKIIANGIPLSEVLDSIKGEIQENINYNKRMNYQGIVAGLLLALDIIDKYGREQIC